MTIPLAMSKLPNRVEGVPDLYYAQRVGVLKKNGLIQSQGDLRRMRFSRDDSIYQFKVCGLCKAFV